MQQKSLGYRILHFPLTKILIGLSVCGSAIALVQIFLVKWIGRGEIQDLVNGIGIASAAILSYVLLYRFYEKRAISELGIRSIGKNIGLGITIGFGLQSLTIAVIYLANGYQIESVNSVWAVIPALAMGFMSAISEEILIRGILFRHLEEKLGSYIALGISALIFGALHLANDGSSLIAGLGIALQAGLLLGAAYIYTKNLWFPIAIHFAWNFSQSGIYGASTSGHTLSTSLIKSKIEGNEIITGGAFGPEASIQATVFCLIVAVVLIIVNKKQNKIIPPYWKASR